MPHHHLFLRLLLAFAFFGACAGSVRAQAPGVAAETFRRGDMVSGSGLVDEYGKPFRIASATGRAVALSFVYTRCPDVRFCPRVAGKFAYLQHRIDPAREHLVLVTLDPGHDSPAVLRAYAKSFGADFRRWSFVTGDPVTLARLADGFGVRSERRNAVLIHAETVAVLDPTGRVGDIIDGAGWDPAGLLAGLGAVAGIGYNPLERALVHLTWSVQHLCGAAPSSEPTALHHAVEGLLSGPALVLFCIVLVVERVRPKRARRVRRLSEPVR
jgi:protein SCO1/2